MSKVIVVNQQDEVLGEQDKKICHQTDGFLHRGFAILLFNKKNEILLSQRSIKKRLWPLIWDASCCSHPKKGETYVQAGKRRLKEELGFTTPLKYLDKFYYRAVYRNVGSEEEICAVLHGQADGQIKPNLNEIADIRWMTINELKKEINQNPGGFAPWLKIAIQKCL